MSNKTGLGYIHVPRTGGWSLRSSICRDKTHRIKYLGHVSNSRDTQDKYTTVACVRHPYDRFISMYKHRLAHYVDDSKWKIQHYINNMSHGEWKGYNNHWFKHSPPDILMRHTHLQSDWEKLNRLFDLNLSSLPHLHDTSTVQYSEPSPEQKESILYMLSLIHI